MAKADRIGGSFAPAITPEVVAQYRQLATETDPKIQEAIHKLCDMVDRFQETPESTLRGTAHPSGVGLMVPLEDHEVQRMDEHIPWDYELKAYGEMFDTIDPLRQKDLRNAAFHLLWMANELYLDREPMTKDKLPDSIRRRE